MTSTLPRNELTEWRWLQHLARERRHRHLREYAGDSVRAAALLHRAGPLLLDLSRQRLDLPVMQGLIRLAEAVKLPEAISALMDGEAVNRSENRPALHTALRLPPEHTLAIDGRDILPDIHQSLARMSDMVDRLHAGQWRGVSGQPITDVINLGVGGSSHGPLMAVQALREFAPAGAAGINVHFVSSIDGVRLAELLAKIDPETTVFLVSSKSFTTPDTLANAQLFLQWMLDAGHDRQQVLQHHFIGISANPEKMSAWGIPDANQLLFWDWVGGRYSLWSAIGLPVAVALGMTQFRQLLDGAAFMDRHFRETPLAANLPVLLGLTGVWNASFLNIGAHAVLPYDGRLGHLPAYLSQLEMESNGKSVDNRGRTVSYPTCPVLWGEVGSDAQHTFFQLLHQGGHDVSSDFIVPVNRYRAPNLPSAHYRALQIQHRLTLANCLAQAGVLMLGNDAAEEPGEVPNWRHYRGNQPSSVLLLDELTPFSLGALIALYEHKVYVMSVLWDINPFDQWGVELGKTIAGSMSRALAGHPDRTPDAPTQQLLDAIREIGRGPAD